MPRQSIVPERAILLKPTIGGTTYVIGGHPLSGAFVAELCRLTGGETIVFTLSELRSMPLRELLRRLFAMKGNLVLATEDEQSHAILPLLQSLALLTPAREVLVVDGDFRFSKFSRWKAPALMWSLMLASIRGMVAVRQARHDLRALNEAPRLASQLRPNARLLYLKTNIWFGIKAGGSVGHVAGVVRAFRRRGYAVDFLACERPALIEDEVDMHKVGIGDVLGVPAEANLYRLDRTVVEHCEQTLRPDCAFIYQRLSVANYSGVRLARRWNVPLILEYNGSEVWVARHWGRPLRYQTLAEAAERACLRHAALVVTVSDILRDELVQHGVEPGRIVTYPNCIDPHVFDPARFPAPEARALRTELGIADDAVVATFIGTFGRWHGVELLAEAIRRLVDTQRDVLERLKLHFLVIGDGLLMPRVRELIGGEACAQFCTLTGLIPQAEAPRYLALSDIFLSPHVPNADGSRFFGSPTKLFEYMAMAKPIVASDLEQIGEVLRDGLHADELPAAAPEPGETRVAVLTHPGSIEDLTQGILFLAERPDWRAVLGANARQECLRKYTWDRHVAAIVTRMEKLFSTTIPSCAAEPDDPAPRPSAPRTPADAAPRVSGGS